jgi:hypothetical protein
MLRIERYAGYLAPQTKAILAMHAEGMTKRQIAERLETAGAVERPWWHERESAKWRVEAMAAMLGFLLKPWVRKPPPVAPRPFVRRQKAPMQAWTPLTNWMEIEAHRGDGP